MVLTHVDLIEKLLQYNRTRPALVNAYMLIRDPLANERQKDKANF